MGKPKKEELKKIAEGAYISFKCGACGRVVTKPKEYLVCPFCQEKENAD